jgi:hypothetical protein
MTVIATFNNIDQANSAVDNLLNLGINRENISIATLEETRDRDKLRHGQENDLDENVQETSEDTSSGVISGIALGGIIGLLTGVAALTIPGLGALLITGPLAAALGGSALAANTVAGASIGGTVGGVSGLVTGLVDKGIGHEDAMDFEKSLQSGGVLVGVETTSENSSQVSEIIADHKASKIVKI